MVAKIANERVVDARSEAVVVDQAVTPVKRPF